MSQLRNLIAPIIAEEGEKTFEGYMIPFTSSGEIYEPYFSTILDLIMLSEEIHNLEGFCIEATMKKELKDIRAVADHKELMYRLQLNKGFHEVSTEDLIKAKKLIG